MKQKNILLFFSLLFCHFIFAQNKMALPDKTGTWILDQTVANVELYHMIKECGGKKVAFLKFNNRNNFKVKINWKETFTTQLEDGVQGAKGQKQLQLPPGESSYNDCSASAHKEMAITSEEVSPAYVAVIAKFAFTDVKVERVK